MAKSHYLCALHFILITASINIFNLNAHNGAYTHKYLQMATNKLYERNNNKKTAKTVSLKWKMRWPMVLGITSYKWCAPATENDAKRTGWPLRTEWPMLMRNEKKPKILIWPPLAVNKVRHLSNYRLTICSMDEHIVFLSAISDQKTITTYFLISSAHGLCAMRTERRCSQRFVACALRGGQTRTQLHSIVPKSYRARQHNSDIINNVISHWRNGPTD